MSRQYVLVTVAYNEEDTIGRVVESVVRQTEQPLRWYIISDGSTDRTDAIVSERATRHEFIRFVRLEANREDRRKLDKVTRAQARAMAVARSMAADADYDFLGNLDADVTFEPDYYARVLDEFEKDPQLGLAGGGAFNVFRDGTVSPTGFVNPEFVGGPVQMFRRRCLEDIGGYAPYGHSDCIAVAKAGMQGWKVRCFPEIRAYHHDMPGQTVREKVPVCFRMGQFDYIMGGLAVFELARCAARLFRPPYVLAGVAMLGGYTWAALRRTPIEIPADVLRYMRKEQWRKLRRRLLPGTRKVAP